VGQRLGVVVEDFCGAPVGEPGVSGGGVQVGGRELDPGLAVGEEYRSGGSSVEQSG
jgi:hypothetical protein